MRHVIVREKINGAPEWLHRIFPLEFCEEETFALRMHEDEVVRATKELLRINTDWEVVRVYD